MATMVIRASGLWAFIQQHKDLGAKRIKAALQAGGAQAWQEWVSGSGPAAQAGGLHDRFKHSGFGRYDLSPRGTKYANWQRRVFGSTLPYRSPLSNRQKAKRRDAGARDAGGHAVDTLKLGDGVRLRRTGTADQATVRLTLPGMRILNTIRPPYGQVYRNELLQLLGRAQAEGEAIAQRALQIAWDILRAEVEATPPQPVQP